MLYLLYSRIFDLCNTTSYHSVAGLFLAVKLANFTFAHVLMICLFALLP